MITREDLFILAQTIYGEARGESYTGKKAVAHVILNRTNKAAGDRDHSIAATCLRHYQFSAWLESDPNREKMQNAKVSDKVFRECLKAALEAIDEPDFTQGATHYHTLAKPSWAKDWPPSWAKGKHPNARFEGHAYYNNID